MDPLLARTTLETADSTYVFKGHPAMSPPPKKRIGAYKCELSKCA